MAILTVRKFPDPVLAQVATPLREVSEAHRVLAQNMLETMYAAPGIGLAAPQVGESVRLIVVDTRAMYGEDIVPTELELQVQFPLCLFNPVIVQSEGKTDFEEACLSVPGYAEVVRRARKIEVEALNKDGMRVTIVTDGLLAICLQHEIDHLDGKLFIDRLSSVKKSLIKGKIKKFGYAEDKEIKEDHYQL